ncbi:MAG: PLP-dependent aminotransferase family protein [Acidobacteria bacterium]|nr:PLP-dependent aminotransferase family protein [Acidobacteriota bacterium]
MTNYDPFFSRSADVMRESAIRKMGTVLAQAADIISFAPGYPAPDTFAWQDFREIAADLLTGEDGTVLQYGATRGFRPLVESIIAVLAARGIAAGREEIVVTTGSQQGLDLVARVLVDPGDVVLLELPSYTGGITAFRNARARLVGVRQEADGLDFDDLEHVLARERAEGRRVRILYVVPNFQNPTGLLISREKRYLLREWAARRDLLLLEDDPYGDLRFDDLDPANTRSIKADDEDGRVVYLSSFSKTIAPGFRVAWIAAPAPIAAKIELAKQAADLCTGAFDQRMIHEACKRGVLERQVPLLRRHYQAKRDVMSSALVEELGDVATWPTPKGGFFLWVTLPESIDVEEMLQRALAQRIIYVAGSAFFVDGSGRNIVRLCYATPSHEHIVEGVRRFARAVREELAERRIAIPSLSRA